MYNDVDFFVNDRQILLKSMTDLVYDYTNVNVNAGRRRLRV